MRIEKTVHVVIFEEPISPYPDDEAKKHAYTRWQRHHSGGMEAEWYPEDANGDVFPYEAFKFVEEVGGDGPLESKFQLLMGE